jgi:serine/threonine protein kinase
MAGSPLRRRPSAMASRAARGIVPVPGLPARRAVRGRTMPRPGIVGTLQYLSPERLEGKSADPRSDIFWFGLVLYEAPPAKRPSAGPSMPFCRRILPDGQLLAFLT